MNEPLPNRKFRLSAAQWVVLVIVLFSLFILLIEVKSGNIEGTGYLFWTDVFVYFLSGLNGLFFLYCFDSRGVNWLYRSSISNALWWTLAAVPHGALAYINVFTSVSLLIIAIRSWLQITQNVLDERQKRISDQK